MSAFEQSAARAVLEQADALGVPVPDDLRASVQMVCGRSNGGAVLYADAHPDEDDPSVPDELRWCCYGVASGSLAACTCWEPTYNLAQAVPIPPATDAEPRARDRMCGDCAFRPDSPERSEAYTAEHLMSLPARGERFWCHDGMRRPVEWRHPAGVTIAGSPDDWQPPIRDAIPFRANGQPALLCAGWAARATRAKEHAR